MANISSLQDAFTAFPDAAVWMPFDFTEWSSLSDVVTFADGRVSLKDLNPGGYFAASITTVAEYDFDAVSVGIDFTPVSLAGSNPDAFCELMMYQDQSVHEITYPRNMGMSLENNDGVRKLVPYWHFFNGWASDTPPTYNSSGTYKAGYYESPLDMPDTGACYLKLTKSIAGDRFVGTYLVSTDRITWTTVYQFTANLDPPGNPPYRAYLGGTRAVPCYIFDFNVPAPPPEDDPTAQTPRAPRTLDPGATVPARSQACTNLLDLIREFSTAVRGAVRILSGSTIEMVDPNEPLPTGWDAGSGGEYYSRLTHGVNANTKVLRLSNGYMDLATAADIVVNDAGLLTSGFRIPGRLPVPDLDPAPVSRVSYTMTPKEFRASVELFYPDTPLIVRER